METTPFKYGKDRVRKKLVIFLGLTPLITGYTGFGGAIFIPTNINGLAVTSIGTNAFQFVTNLAGVTIPGSVTSIGFAAFADCPTLTNATISEGVTTIGADAFSFSTIRVSVLTF